MAEQLNRKRRVRAGHRASATRMKNRIDELLGGTEPPNTAAVAQLGMSLKEKLEVLKALALDSEALDLIEEEALAGEIEDANTFKGEIYAVLARLEEFNAAGRHTTMETAREPPAVVRAPAVITR